MSPFDKLPDRIKYYLLDFKDNEHEYVYKKYGKCNLDEFKAHELSELYEEAVKYDRILLHRI